MKPWTTRPSEEAFLLNPAFVALLGWSMCKGYSDADDKGLPFALSFLISPIVLHKSTRETLPRSIKTSLPAWLEENVRARVGLTNRARALGPFVREGLLFGVSCSTLSISEGRLLASTKPRGLARHLKSATDEVRDCHKRAEFLGKWFAGAGSVATVMALWGVRP